jgi:hypothetical protein
MSIPLATLRRGSALVAFHRWPVPEAARFRRVDEAVLFLRPWARDAAAMSTLRIVLREALRSGPLFTLDDDRILDVLAACLADGTVSVAAAEMPPAEGPGDVVSAFQAAAAPPPPPPPPPATPLPIATPAGLEPPSDILEALEEVQIEGAEVRPEIEQALAEIDVSLGNVQLASVSLAPTPTKVDAITTEMSEVSAGAVQTLDEL